MRSPRIDRIVDSVAFARSIAASPADGAKRMAPETIFPGGVGIRRRIDKLITLKDQVESVLASKITEQRRTLESELSKLGRFQGGAARGKSAFGRGGARGSVAPKYRNPENPAETWAGRGLKPRWLTAAMKGGKKMEDFAIDGSGPSPKANGRKKGRKSRK